MRTILLADNQDLTKAGWLYLLQLAGIHAFEEVIDKKALIQLCLTYPGAVIILDYTLFDFEQEDELIILHEKYPETDWIICAESLTDNFIRNLIFKTNRFSIILKDSSSEDLQSALKMALRRQRYISSAISNRMFENNRQQHTVTPPSTLTATEKEILKELAMGKSTREIASQRNISTHTVMTHRKNIFRKIEVNTVYEATKYAMKTGLVDLSEYYI
ncbi:MAG: response regulator transcription factor [Paludibacter sp.]|jgi:DNA-binding NarL/FixJ family response regulator|nr:response regulator transcription factor [Paludibacter sp.]